MTEMSTEELVQMNAESDLILVLVPAALGGAMNYHELSPDGRELDARERASAIEQLITGAVAITTVERERDVVERMPESVPIAETLMLLRVMQQGLILALSHDPEVRARAVDGHTVLIYMTIAQKPWDAEMKARAKARP